MKVQYSGYLGPKKTHCNLESNRVGVFILTLKIEEISIIYYYLINNYPFRLQIAPLIAFRLVSTVV